jgi:hypothetical protein
VLVAVPRVTPVYALVINIGAHITANNNKLIDNYQGNPVEKIEGHEIYGQKTNNGRQITAPTKNKDWTSRTH